MKFKNVLLLLGFLITVSLAVAASPGDDSRSLNVGYSTELTEMESVRAKFFVQSVEEFNGGQKKVNMHCQYSKNPEDNSFAEATPSGNCSLTVNNKAAADFFKPGTSFFADFTRAEVVQKE